MEILTQEQVEAQPYKARIGHASKVAHIYEAIGKISIGQGLKIAKSEWPHKNAPSNSTFPSRLKTQGQAYSVRSLADDQGFVISRKV